MGRRRAPANVSKNASKHWGVLLRNSFRWRKYFSVRLWLLVPVCFTRRHSATTHSALRSFSCSTLPWSSISPPLESWHSPCSKRLVDRVELQLWDSCSATGLRLVWGTFQPMLDNVCIIYLRGKQTTLKARMWQRPDLHFAALTSLCHSLVKNTRADSEREHSGVIHSGEWSLYKPSIFQRIGQIWL